MRAFVLVLVLANIVLFAYQQGWLGQWPQDGREPARSAQQIEPQAIRLLTDADVRGLRERGREAGNAAERTDAAACLELGDFAPDVAARVQQRLEATNPAARISTAEVDTAGWHMVFLPPAKTRAEAERAAEDLRSKGVRELLVIEDNSPLRYAISLGQFKDRDLALKHQAELEQRGVKGVRISVRSGAAPAMRVRVSPADAAVATQLAALQKEFGATRLAPCAQ